MRNKEEIEYRVRELKTWIEKEREVMRKTYLEFGQILEYLEKIIELLERER